MQKDTIPTPPVPPAPKLSPDEVRIKGQIISKHPLTDHHNGRLTVHVVKFLGMGSSAPVVSQGDTIEVRLANLHSEMKKGDLFVFDLKYLHILTKYRDTTASWMYIKSKKIKKMDNEK